MFEFWSIYTAVGLIAGLGLSMLLFTKLNFPAWLRRNMHLNTKTKGLLAVLLLGTLLATMVLVVSQMLQLSAPVAQSLEGVTIGFNCAIVLGLLREQDNASNRTGPGSKSGARKRSTDNRGRRSKG